MPAARTKTYLPCMPILLLALRELISPSMSRANLLLRGTPLKARSRRGCAELVFPAGDSFFPWLPVAGLQAGFPPEIWQTVNSNSSDGFHIRPVDFPLAARRFGERMKLCPRVQVREYDAGRQAKSSRERSMRYMLLIYNKQDEADAMSDQREAVKYGHW